MKRIIVGIALVSAMAIALIITTGDVPYANYDIPVTSDASIDVSSDASSTTFEIASNSTSNVIDNVESLFESKQSRVSVLSGMSADVMTIEFDGIHIRPGMTAGEILDVSSWQSLRENDMLAPGESSYIVLTSEYWTNKRLQLNRVATAQNGEIVLWLHNYSKSAQKMRDCVLYKYKINFHGCKQTFLEQPSLRYLDKFTLGYDGQYPMCEYELARDNIGVYTRRFYGSVDEQQVIFDSSSDEGLFAITVTYNLHYGPNFLYGGESSE